MQVVTVRRASNGRAGYGKTSWGRQCKECRKVLKEGQRVLRITSQAYVHVRCLSDLIAGEPDSMSPLEWLELQKGARAERMRRDEEERRRLDEEFRRARDELIAMLHD